MSWRRCVLAATVEEVFLLKFVVVEVYVRALLEFTSILHAFFV